MFRSFEFDLPLLNRGSNKVVICNIHVLYNPKRGEIKLGQVRVLLDRAHAISKIWNDAPIVLCGDFNCTPKSPLYNFISEQKKWGSDHIALASELAFMNSFDQS